MRLSQKYKTNKPNPPHFHFLRCLFFVVVVWTRSLAFLPWPKFLGSRDPFSSDSLVARIISTHNCVGPQRLFLTFFKYNSPMGQCICSNRQPNGQKSNGIKLVYEICICIAKTKISEAALESGPGVLLCSKCPLTDSMPLIFTVLWTFSPRNPKEKETRVTMLVCFKPQTRSYPCILLLCLCFLWVVYLTRKNIQFSFFQDRVSQAGMPLVTALRRQRQLDLCELRAAWSPRASSMTGSKVTQGNTVLKSKKTTTTKKKGFLCVTALGGLELDLRPGLPQT